MQNRFRSWMILAAALAAAALLYPAAASNTPQEEGSARVVVLTTHNATLPVRQRITLGLGKAVVVEIDTDARDVLVSNPEIVDAVVRSPRRVFLMAQKGGQTNAFFFDTQGRQVASIDIRVEKDVTDLARLLQAAFPGSDIRIQAINDSVVLTGNVTAAVQAQRAVEIAASFTGDPKKVINALAIRSSEQVMLKVRIAEMQRTVAKQFGVDMTTAMTVAGVPMTFGTSNQFGLVGHALNDLSGGQAGSVCPNAYFPTTTSTTTNGATTLSSTWSCTGTNANNLQGTIRALEQVGLVHILAEPNLTAVSGETARFLAGGEFPVPVARDRDGNVTLQFKPFGVGLSFTPVVLSGGRISLQLSTEVSELTNTGAYTLQGSTSSTTTTIPALSVRRAETTVEVPSGGTFAIAGLMQHTTRQVLEAFPGVKDLPVLGALFRSRDFANEETELVVLVTAYLVRPTTETQFAAPTDGYQVPTDLETILLGRLNAVYSRDNAAGTRAEAPGGYIVQ
jgi:pilus assembly protein CpaC